MNGEDLKFMIVETDSVAETQTADAAGPCY